MKRFKVGTLILLIAIAALGLALVIQHDRAVNREVDLLRRLRDSTRGHLRLIEEEYRRLVLTERLSKNDPRVKGVAAELEQAVSERNAIMSELKRVHGSGRWLP